MESVIAYIDSLNPVWIYVVVFSIAFIENLFPPSPSDVVIVFAGSLILGDRVHYIPVLVSATLGSTLGFVIMYKIGDWFGGQILAQGRFSFIPAAAVIKVESWFKRYGYWVIAANRFLAGTRAVVSFFAGMSKLHIGKTTALSCVSALAWNVFLVTAGYFLGTQWQRVGSYLTVYSQLITAIIVLMFLFFIARYIYRKKPNEKGG